MRFRFESDHEQADDVAHEPEPLVNEYGRPQGDRIPGKFRAANVARRAVQLTPSPARPGRPPVAITHEIRINTVRLEPVADRVGRDLAAASAIYERYGIRLIWNGHNTIPEAEARAIIGQDERDALSAIPPERQAELRRSGAIQPDGLDMGRTPTTDEQGRTVRGQVSRETRALLEHGRSPGIPTAYWVPSMNDAQSRTGHPTGYSIDTAAWAGLLPNREGVVIAENAGPNTLAHELGHLLMRAGHEDFDSRDESGNGIADEPDTDVPLSNIMYPSSTDPEGRPRGTDFTPQQIARIRRSRYAVAVGVRPPAEQRASGNAPGPAQRAALPGRRDPDPDTMHDLADEGVAAASSALPHLDAIQQAFGEHDVGDVRAEIGGRAANASDALGARAYARGDRIAFAQEPDLHLAAHEAAHVVQQRGGVILSGGVGRTGDEHERHADAVADRVVRGERADDLLARYAGRAAPVQRKAIQRDPPRGRQSGLTGSASQTVRLPPRRIPLTGQSRWGHLEIEGSFTGGFQRAGARGGETFESVEISRDQGGGSSITAESRGRIADAIAPELHGLVEDDFELSGDREGFQLTAGLRTRAVELGPLSADFRLNLIRSQRGSVRLELPSATANISTRVFTLQLDDQSTVQGSAQLQITWHPNWIEIGRRVAQWIGRRVLTSAGEAAATEGAAVGTAGVGTAGVGTAGAGTVAGAVAIPVVAATVIMGTIIYSLLEAIEESARRSRATHYIDEYAYRLAFGVFDLGHAVPNRDPSPGQYGSWTDWVQRAIREGRRDGWRALGRLSDEEKAGLRQHWQAAPRYAAEVANEVARRLNIPIGYDASRFPVGAG
jgi:hypothetical protein